MKRFLQLFIFCFVSAAQAECNDYLEQYYPFPDCKHGFYTTLEGLMWKGSAEGVEFVILDSLQTFTQSINISGTYLEPVIKYHPGVRAGIGYFASNRNWDVYAAYTAYNMTDSRNVTVKDSQVLIGSRAVAVLNPTIETACSAWTAKLNVFDLVIGRPIVLDNYGMLKPYAGFKALTLHHFRTVNYAGGFLEDSPIKQIYKNNFNSFGLQTGIVLNFILHGTPSDCSGRFGLYTNLAIALIAGNDAIKNRELYGGALSTETADCYQNVKFMADSAIGIAWDKAWNRFEARINFGWELHRYPNIWGRQIAGTLASPIGIFTTQGFTFGAALYF